MLHKNYLLNFYIIYICDGSISLDVEYEISLHSDILNNYFDQFYWHSISKRVHAVTVWRIQGNIQYANKVLALDLLEIVLIGWHSARFRMLQDFTSWCEGCTRASRQIVLDMIILSYISFIVSFCILLRWG